MKKLALLLVIIGLFACKHDIINPPINVPTDKVITGNITTTTTLTADKEWTLNNNDYATLVWLSAGTPPTQAELDAQWPAVAYQQQVAQVEATRRTQYEAQSDGIFFEWQRGTNTKEAWEAAVQAVKDANPYPPAP